MISTILLGLVLPAQAQDWAKDSRQLQELIWKSYWAKALEVSSKLLNDYHEDAQITRIYSHRIHAFMVLKKWDEAFAETQELEKADFSKNRKLLADLYFQFASQLHRHRQGEKALKTYHLLIEKCPKQTDFCARARIGAGDCYLHHVKNAAEKAAAEYASVERDYPGEQAHCATAVRRGADTLSRLKKHAEAAAEYHKVLTKYRRFFQLAELEKLTCTMGYTYEAIEDWTGARRAFRDAEALTTREDVKNELAWRRATILYNQKKWAEAIVEFQQTIARYGIANEGRCLDAARKIAECYAALENYDEALKAAHVVYDAGDVPWAVRNIVNWLKTRDGNAERLENFVLFQMHGPKGEDGGSDLPNVLAEIGYPACSADVQKDFENSLGALKDDWQDCYRKGRLCLYRGKPTEAVSYLYRAFLNCPNKEAYRHGQEIVGGAVRAICGTEAGLEPWYAFLRDGTRDENIGARLRELLRQKPRRQQRTTKVLEVLTGLEKYILEPFPAPGNRWAERTRRITMLHAYLRIAVEKGCEDDLIGFARRLLAHPGIADLYQTCADVVSLAFRARDGHLAGALRWFDQIADPRKTPNMNPRARQDAKRALGELTRTRSWKRRHAPNAYRQYLPKRPRKK